MAAGMWQSMAMGDDGSPRYIYSRAESRLYQLGIKRPHRSRAHRSILSGDEIGLPAICPSA